MHLGGKTLLDSGKRDRDTLEIYGIIQMLRTCFPSLLSSIMYHDMVQRFDYLMIFSLKYLYIACIACALINA